MVIMQSGDHVRRISTGKNYYIKYRQGRTNSVGYLVTNDSLMGITIMIKANDLELITKGKGN